MNFVNGINRDQFIMMDFEANVAFDFYIACPVFFGGLPLWVIRADENKISYIFIMGA